MPLNLSKEQRESLEADLAGAMPYSDDDPEMHTIDLDGEETPERFARWKATTAKKLLEKDDREKREAAAARQGAEKLGDA